MADPLFDIFSDNENVILAFDAWLQSDEWYEACFANLDVTVGRGQPFWHIVQEDPPENFLDYVTIWLIHGHGYRHFPTFETFLLAVVDLIQEWQLHNLWKDVDDRSRFRDDTRFRALNTSSRSSTSVYDELGHPFDDVAFANVYLIAGASDRYQQATRHPVLNRHRWELNRQQYYSGIDHRPTK